MARRRLQALADSVARDGDPGAQAVVNAARLKVKDLPADVISRSLVRRTSLLREWRLFSISMRSC